MKKVCLITGLSLLAAMALAGCAKKADEPAAAPQPQVDADKAMVTFATNAPQLGSISVAAAQARTLAVTHVTGRLYWDDDVTVKIFTPVSGRVVAIKAELDEPVAAGGSLAEIDSPDFGQSLAAARTAAANFAAADKAYSRAKQLLAHGSAASKDVEAAEATYEAAEAERDRAVAQLANYGGSIDSTNSIYLLRSPLAGVLVERNITPGQELRADMMLGNVPQTFNPLFTVSDPAKLWLQLDVSETDLTSLQTGLPLRITTQAYPGKVFEGTLKKIGDTLDPTTRTVKARGLVNNPERLLKAEMYVLVDVVQDTTRVPDAGVEVPAPALFLRDKNYCLFVEIAPGQFQRRTVAIGAERDGKTPVFAGLQTGEKVVTEGALLLQALVEPSS